MELRRVCQNASNGGSDGVVVTVCQAGGEGTCDLTDGDGDLADDGADVLTGVGTSAEVLEVKDCYVVGTDVAEFIGGAVLDEGPFDCDSLSGLPVCAASGNGTFPNDGCKVKSEFVSQQRNLHSTKFCVKDLLAPLTAEKEARAATRMEEKCML